jgi:undecaprenyl-diphosphatase
MELLQGLILGVVQGIAEWLPISSEGINTLILIHFFDEPTDEAIARTIWLHLGTLLAALLYFRREVSGLLRHLPQYATERGDSKRSELNALTTFLMVSTVLTGVVGAPLIVIGLRQESVPAGAIMAIIGAFLIITGLVQRYARLSTGTETTPGRKDAVLLGVVQGFSALPGLSRSGLTVSALLFRGYETERAVGLSFLMSIPVTLAAAVGISVFGGVSVDLAAVGSVVTAFLFGILTIGALMRIATRVAFWKFCIIVGVLSLLPLLIERF